MEEIIYLNNISKRYKDKIVVNKVNMHVSKGDIYGFVGENGAGKTTILRIIGGLVYPLEGEFFIDNVSSKNENIVKARERMASIIEAPSLDKSFSAIENLKMVCMLKGIKKSEQELNDLLIEVGLDPSSILKKKIKNFSLGMRQRLALCTCLIGDPSIILLDEPMNGLDPQGFIEIRNLILKLNKERGVTFIISSHILSELEKIATKIGFISKGKMLEEIKIEDLHLKARKSLDIKVEDNLSLMTLLKEELSLLDVELKNDTIKIYDEVNINEVMKFLVSKNIQVISFSLKEENIESYYLKMMMGGNKND